MKNFRDTHTMNILISTLDSKLQEAMLTKDLVDVTGLRRIGKTTALVRLAKARKLPIMVASTIMVDLIKEEFGFNDVHSIKSQSLRGKQFPNGVLIEEGVYRKEAEDLGYEIVGGYHSFTY